MSADELREWLLKVQADIEHIAVDGWNGYIREALMRLEVEVVKVRQTLDQTR